MSGRRNYSREPSPEQWTLLTSWFIIFETYALFLSRVRRGREVALSFLDRLANARVQIIGDSTNAT